MFAFIEGKIEDKDASWVVLNVHGVGYFLNVSLNTYSALGSVGETARLYTYLNVRDDAMLLYGFIDATEKRMFERLITVSGIGPKVAMSTLSGMTPDKLALAIVAEDERAFSKIPGIGKKTAQRIILELKEKISDDVLLPAADVSVISGGIEKDAALGLAALGYGASEAAQAVSLVSGQADTVEELIMLALKSFGKK
jgi:Holliday junction DNA helicase RuvA